MTQTKVEGSLQIPTPSILITTGTHTVLGSENDTPFIADSTSGNLIIRFVATLGDGFKCSIKKIASANTVTLDSSDSSLFDGAATKVLSTDDDFIQIVCDGTDFHITSAASPPGSNLITDPFFLDWGQGTSRAGLSGATGLRYGPTLMAHKVISNSPVVLTASQQTDVPTVAQAGYKIPYSCKWLVTTPDAALAAGEASYLEFMIPGPKYANIHQQTYTYSLWIKIKGGTTPHSSSKVCLAFTNSANDRSYVADTVITTDNTWQNISVTIPADTTGTYLFTPASVGLRVRLALAVGSTYQGTDLTFESANDISTSATTNLADEANDEIWIAAPKLELGAVASSANHSNFDQAHLEILRYYSNSYGQNEPPGTVTSNGVCKFLASYTNGTQSCGIQFPVKMIKVPSVIIWNPDGTTGEVVRTSNNVDVAVTASEISMAGFGMVGGPGQDVGDNANQGHYEAEARFEV